jgi:dual-specificity kinase
MDSRPGDSQRNSRKADWAEFYKNGVPEEVILIDDDDEDPKLILNTHSVNGSGYENPRHADKKRKTGATSTYDPVYNNPQPSYSTTQTPYYDNSSSNNNTVSTDRTAPALKTTASSSLAPSVRNGSYLPPPLEEGVVGQKRKRTRNVTAEEVKAAKRRELERVQSPYSAYIPPPNPPLKSKDIHVPVVKDVSLSLAFPPFPFPLTDMQSAPRKGRQV